MKKILAFLFVFLFALQFVAAADVLYIVKTTASADSHLTSLIQQAGYTYDLRTSGTLGSVNWSQYSIILVGNQDFGVSVPNIPVNVKKALIVNRYHMDEWNWVTTSVSSIGSNQALQAQ